MRRRDLISVMFGAMAWPLSAYSQQNAPVRRLGALLLYSEDDKVGQQLIAAFVQRLADAGWHDGDNIHIDYRWAGDDVARIRRAASELIGLRPDVILATSALTLEPLRQMTTTVPLVFIQIADPVGSGLVTSMSRPGGNITGFALAEFATASKTLEVLKELVPQVKRAAVIYNPVQSPQVGMWQAIETTARSLSIQVNAINAIDADNLSRVIDGFAGEPDRGLIVLPNPITIANRKLIIERAILRRLPSIYLYSYFVRDGGLASYGSEPTLQFRDAAFYVDRILKGEKPGNLPVQLPTKFNLAVNLKTAKAIGITVRESFLLRADEVIE